MLVHTQAGVTSPNPRMDAVPGASGARSSWVLRQCRHLPHARRPAGEFPSSRKQPETGTMRSRRIGKRWAATRGNSPRKRSYGKRQRNSASGRSGKPRSRTTLILGFGNIIPWIPPEQPWRDAYSKPLSTVTLYPSMMLSNCAIGQALPKTPCSHLTELPGRF